MTSKLFTVSLNLLSCQMVIKEDCAVQFVFKQGKQYQDNYWRQQSRKIQCQKNSLPQHIEINHQFTRTLTLTQRQNGTYHSSKVTLKCEIFLNSEYGDKHASLSIDLVQLIDQGMQQVKKEDEGCLFDYRISVVEKFEKQSFGEYLLGNIKKDQKRITGDEL